MLVSVFGLNLGRLWFLYLARADGRSMKMQVGEEGLFESIEFEVTPDLERLRSPLDCFDVVANLHFQSLSLHTDHAQLLIH